MHQIDYFYINTNYVKWIHVMTWKQDVETFLAFLEANCSVVDSHHKEIVMQSFDVSFVVCLNKLLNKQSSCW